ncbi:MAG: hypothetical protein OER87_20045, partial [Gammaproteobacteria bacterium]|nr:hypothetical protein [Gammaproteobacteria bacterium]
MKILQLSAISLLLCVLAACSQENSPDSAQDGQTPIDERSGANIPQIVEVFNVGDSVYVRSLAVEADTNRLWVGTSLGVNEIDLATNDLVN